MDLSEAIRNRRSIRKFTDQDISRPDLEAILDAVRWSPSWGNTQCWEIIIVQDREIKHQLNSTLRPKNPASCAVVNSSVILVLTAIMKKSGYYKGESLTQFSEWFMYDLGLASQNICLTAHSLGIGSVIVAAFDHERVRKILKVPEEYKVVTMIPLGYPAHEPLAPKRRSISEYTHWDYFCR